MFSSRSTSCVTALLERGFLLAVEQKGWDPDCPIGKYVSWLNADGMFDETDLTTRLVREAETIACLEPEITRAISDANGGQRG